MKKAVKFKYACPKCGVTLEFDEDPRGETYQCPDCNSVFEIPVAISKAKKAKPPKGCYMLGLFLGIVGVFIAHMTDGPAGVREALRGFVFQVICVVVGYFGLFVLPYLLVSLK